MMQKFEFLLGEWILKYNIPSSSYSTGGNASGEGTFKRILSDKYVTFDYKAYFTQGNAQAYDIFVWDKKSQIYRYWWFEDSGSFMTATCNFLNDNTLALNWHNSLLVQTFEKVDQNRLRLRMSNPKDAGKYELVLEVLFERKQSQKS